MSSSVKIVYTCADGHTRQADYISGRHACAAYVDGHHCGAPTGPCFINGVVPPFVNGQGTPVFPKVQDFGSGEGRVKGAWMDEIVHGRRGIYITCGYCGTINDLSDISVDPGGGKCECFHCGQCGCDHFVYLKDFREDVPRKPLSPRYSFRHGRVMDNYGL